MLWDRPFPKSSMTSFKSARVQLGKSFVPLGGMRPVFMKRALTKSQLHVRFPGEDPWRLVKIRDIPRRVILSLKPDS